VGYPNVGKSTLINLLAPGTKAKVSNVSGTTKKTQWIRVGRLRIMDSPGVIPSSDKSISLGLTSAKDPQKIKHPERVAMELVSRLRKGGARTLERFYGVEAESDYDLFLAIGKKRGYLLKGAEIDERRTALKILEDWQRGKIGLN
jgi:ribosome biogenesis GTPase A